MNKVIGLIVAMESELELIKDLLHGCKKVNYAHNVYYVGEYENKKIVVAQSGIGKVNAAVCATRLIDNFHPDTIVSSGVCGCLDSENIIHVGDIVCANYIYYHDVWCGEPNKLGQIQGMPPMYISYNITNDILQNLNKVYDNSVFVGGIASGDWFVDSVEKARDIKKDFNTDKVCIDMESGALAQVCYANMIPFYSIRIISDCPLNPNSMTYEEFWSDAPKNLLIVVKELITNL